MSPYTGPTVRGVNYGPTWPGWVQGSPNTQTYDSDFVNDAFQSLWSDQYVDAPPGDKSAPVTNNLYRDDLGPISSHRFNLVRPYDWNMARGSSSETGPALDHINFLKRAQALGLKVVVPVSDYFLGNNEYSWNGQSPDKITASKYNLDLAPKAIQTDFNLFISSITDPATGKIHAGVHSISVGNEGDLGEGGLAGTTTASQFLARTIWWIYNLHLKLPAIPLSATISNGDQGQPSTGSYWFQCFIAGVKQGDLTPLGCNLGKTFTETVPGLTQVDPGYATYYYNSVNISQTSTDWPYKNTLAETLNTYDSWPSGGWPGAKFNVPLMLMEVFTPDRNKFSSATGQADAAVKQVQAMEKYLKDKSAGGPRSTTQFMGYNYFEFNDEPAKGKQTGLFLYSNAPGASAQTGTTAVWFQNYPFPGMTFSVRSLTATAGPSGPGHASLIAAIAKEFP